MKSVTKAHLFIRAGACAIAAITLGLIHGCGGGGSSGLSAPVLTLTVQATKTFHFTWADVSGETEYRLMENPDGSSGYTNVATIAADSTSYDMVVSLPKRISASYILQSCNSSGCTDSKVVSVSGNLVDGIGYMKAATPTSGAQFGFSIALSSNDSTLAIGAPGEGGNGAVYLYNLSGGVWTQTAHLTASNPGNGDNFGYTIALSADGSTLAVGAWGEDEAATGITVGSYTTNTNGVSNSGAVYMFSNSGSGWVQDAYIKAPAPAVDDSFGFGLALTKVGTTRTLAVGSPQAPTANGTVYLFSNSGTGWVAGATLTASNAGLGDLFGRFVALASHVTNTTTTLTLAVGAPWEDEAATGITVGTYTTNLNGAYNSGAVYLFTNINNGGWNQDAYIKASNGGGGFGLEVALSADGLTLAASAIYESENVTGVFSGAYSSNVGGANQSGAVYLFSNSGSGWAQDAYIKASNTGASDLFGTFIALSSDGTTLAVSADYEDESVTGVFPGSYSANSDGVQDCGAVYLFSNNGGGWAQNAYVKPPNVVALTHFGTGVALSSNGDGLWVGEKFESSTAANSGAVYLY